MRTNSRPGNFRLILPWKGVKHFLQERFTSNIHVQLRITYALLIYQTIMIIDCFAMFQRLNQGLDLIRPEIWLRRVSMDVFWRLEHHEVSMNNISNFIRKNHESTNHQPTINQPSTNHQPTKTVVHWFNVDRYRIMAINSSRKEASIATWNK